MITHEYFMQEIRSFLSLLGSRKFWEMSDDQRNGAVQGLTHVYMKVVDDGNEFLQEARCSAMKVALENFNRRATHCLLKPI